ncbi:MAG: hypothetical protein P1V97_15315 [Planctomycetota bacterium]|nr:hypothetical protein [Planctomycetota bacterium]
MSEDWQVISDLLDEGQLHSFHWEALLKRICIVTQCLRTGSDGEGLERVPVLLSFTDIEVLFIGHHPTKLNIAPEDYKLKRKLSHDDLKHWEFSPLEFYLSVNSPQRIEDALFAFDRQWIIGEESDLSGSDYSIVISLSHSPILGLPTNNIELLFACGGISVESQGAPLDLDTWTMQYKAWWESWKTYWDKKLEDREIGEDSAGLEEVFIPAGIEPPPDLDYFPPREPAFQLEPHDLPEELVRPIRMWFESKHSGDGVMRAQSSERLGKDLAEQAEDEEEDFIENFDGWGYARQIDSWWSRGSVSFVEVRGLEHRMPFEGRTEENTETVWSFQLRWREDRWIIRTLSQGWVPSGSAPAKAAAEKSWLKDWTSGHLKTNREKSF